MFFLDEKWMWQCLYVARIETTVMKDEDHPIRSFTQLLGPWHCHTDDQHVSLGFHAPDDHFFWVLFQWRNMEIDGGINQ